MDTDRLKAELSRPDAFPEPTSSVSIEETHISVVFLGDTHVYKVKKPVRYPFVDYGSLEARRRFCRREVILNRRLAPRIYEGVVPITEQGGRLTLDGAGEPVEWAVRMKRLPAEATLARRIEQAASDEAALPKGTIETIGRRIARFHARAARGPAIARYGRFRIVAGNALENLRDGRSQVGTFVNETVFERLAERTRRELLRRRRLVEERAREGIPRDTHGDLRTEHVYLFPDVPPPEDVVIVDCVEFNDRYRYADPVADQAFLTMDLRFAGRWDLADRFVRSYFRAREDPNGRRLMRLYTSYRSAVRAKVQGLKAENAPEGSSAASASAERARAHWLLALGELAPPDQRPCLVLVGGLPGTGKSTLAARLADRANLEVLDTDRIRKELAGLPLEETPGPEESARLYSKEGRARTYAAIEHRIRSGLRRGGRLLVDASFHRAERRRPFLELARAHAVRAVLIVCETGPQTARRRLAGRERDPSDADWSIYVRMREAWEPVETYPGVPVVHLDAEGTQKTVARRGLKALRAHRLA